MAASSIFAISAVREFLLSSSARKATSDTVQGNPIPAYELPTMTLPFNYFKDAEVTD
jgi:hypothetical protein